MDDDIQQYERHALTTYDRDRLCVSFRLLSPMDVPATRGAISLWEGHGGRYESK